jgi:AcrR family transcriptional regulator
MSVEAEAAAAPDVDPRLLRSRTRLIEAAKSLLASDGVGAVTVEAVTRMSKVARTTVYLHFGSSTGLLVAAFEQLLPKLPAAPTTGTLQQQVTALLTRQAEVIDDAPMQLTALAWLDLDMAIVQLVGPVAFGRLSGMKNIGAAQCEQIVADFFAARRHARTQHEATPRHT